MFQYKAEYYKNENGGEVITRLESCCAPLMDKRTLDETLDLSVLEMSASIMDQPFEPFTKFKITVTDLVNGEEDAIYRYLARDDMEQQTFQKPYKFRHSLTLIEPSKILEREICDNLTFTNTLIANSASNPSPAGWTIDRMDGEWKLAGNAEDVLIYNTPVLAGTVITAHEVYAAYRSTLSWPQVFVGDIRVIAPDGSITRLREPRPGGGYIFEGLQYTCTAPGVYKIQYEFSRPAGMTSRDYFIISFPFLVYTPETAPKRKSIVDTLNRLLAVTPLRREGIQTSRFKLSSEFVGKYSSVESPEFCITSKTLWEALREIGGYIHALPYLRVTDYDWNTVDFMPLGGRDEAILNTPYSGNYEAWDVEQYCTNIDTIAENIMNVDNELQGTVTEPYEGGYMSTRAEDGVLEINESTAIIPTAHPIYKVISLEAGINGNLVDITPRIEETAKYRLLSAYSDVIGASKAFALEYTQGRRNITGLSLKREGDMLPASWKKCAIVNILNQKEVTCTNSDLPRVQFRVRYIPFINMRLKQYKTNYTDFKTPGTLIYNQQANVIDSSAYGESLKGATAKLGNLERKRTYYFKKLGDIPRVGTLCQNDYFVSVTQCEYWQEFIKCTVDFSKDYNKLSEYVGLKNEQRYYEVSEKMSQQRHSNYGEFCVIGNPVSGDAAITPDGIQAVKQTFLQSDEKYKAASCVQAQGVSQEKQIDTTVLSVSSLACGNSIAMHFAYADNFSAGNQSVPDGGRANRIQQSTPYSDNNGFFEKLRVGVYAGLEQRGEEIANNLPQSVGAVSGLRYFNYWDRPFLYQKDSREIPDMTLQTHFVSNRKEIVIGPALAKNNPMVAGISSKRVAKIVSLPYNIGKFDGVLDLSQATQWSKSISSVFLPGGNSFITYPLQTPVACKAIAFVTSDTNELILGVNASLKAGGTILPISFSFVNKVG